MFSIKRGVYKNFEKLTLGVSCLINLQYKAPLGNAFPKNPFQSCKITCIKGDIVSHKQKERKFYCRPQNQLAFHKSSEIL